MATLLEPVEPRPVDPPRLGLVRSAFEPSDGTGGRWERGVEWLGEPCGDDLALLDPSCDVATTMAGADTGTIPAAQEFRPLWVVAREVCSTFGAASVDVQQRAKRALLASESFAMERELWRGTAAQAAGFSNPYLADGPTILKASAATEAVFALALLEQHAGEAREGGGRLFIHAPRLVVTKWDAFGLLRPESGLLLTVNDAIVVPGEGYDGSGPEAAQASRAGDDTDAWVYATGMVELRRGEIQTSFNTVTEVAAENRSRALAWRAFAVTFDDCVHLAIKVTVGT